MSRPRITHYRDFWLFYLREHSRPRTRAWHFLGTGLALACLLAGIRGKPWFFGAALVVGYGPAWIGHIAVEKNRPATLHYPLWSLLSDFRMFAAWLTGRLPRELDRAGIPRPDPKVS